MVDNFKIWHDYLNVVTIYLLLCVVCTFDNVEVGFLHLNVKT